MHQTIAHVALVVRDYDEAIEFFTETLEFTLVEDTYVPEQDKRWVLVAPPGSSGAGTTLLLARPSAPDQEAFIGNQTGGRVSFFLKTDDFRRDYDRMVARGVRFVRPPENADYGTVAVFEDLYGNRWDLIEPKPDLAPAVHLVAGGVGSGKTTRAIELERQLSALRLTVDDMMRLLFHPDSAPGADYQWAIERIVRCETFAVQLAAQELARGRSVVLDFGFLGREQRTRVREACHARGMATRLHYVDVPTEERWRRVQERNTERGESFAMHVTREMFDFCETLLEPPKSSEPPDSSEPR